MIGFNPKVIAQRRITITFTVLLLLVSFFIFRLLSWPKDSGFQIMLGTASFCFSFFVGVLAFIKFFTRKKNKYLFIGSGFLAVSALEGYSLFVSSQVGASLWTASRILLSAFSLLSLKNWREVEGIQKNLGPRVFISAFISTVIIIAAVTLLPSLNPYWRFLVFSRPFEFPAAIFFGLAAFVYFQKGYWGFKFFEFWFLLSLIAAFFTQIYMALSGEFFDSMFYAGQIFTILSYLFALVGLLMSTYAAFKEVETEKKIHAGQTTGEYYLKHSKE